MGLLNIFKKKKPTHEEKVDTAYQCYKKDFVNIIYPGGKEQASNIIHSLGLIYGLNLDKCNAMEYYEILKSYSDIFVKKVIAQHSLGSLTVDLQTKHKNLAKDKTIAQKAVAYIVLCMQNNSFVLKSDKDFEVLNLLADTICQMEQTAKENKDAEKENLNDPEYGLVKNKPIYTRGVEGSDRYLAELKTINGDALTWKRLGSMNVPGINGMVDVYESAVSSGKAYKTLYLNMYGSTNSEKVPQGFSKR